MSEWKDATMTVRTRWGSDVEMTIRTEKPGDDEVIGEVIRGDTYQVGLIRDAPHVAFDIGAHIGTFTVSIAERFPDCQIIAIEPHPRSYDLLVKNTERYPNVRTINGAISYERGNRFADGLRATGGGFVTTPEVWATKGQPTQYQLLDEEIPTYTFADLLKMAGTDSVDLVKWDCEGGEIDSFRNMSDKEAAAIMDMVGEFHIQGGFREFEKVFHGRFPHHTLEGRPHEIADGRNIGWFRARASR